MPGPAGGCAAARVELMIVSIGAFPV